jgi:hypothetical protein
VAVEKEKLTEMSYSEARSLDTFSGVSYYDNSECVFMFDYDTKEKKIKTLGNLIYTRGIRPLVQIRQPRVSVLFLLLTEHQYGFKRINQQLEITFLFYTQL